MSSADFKAMAKDAMNSGEGAVLDFCTLDPMGEGAPSGPAAPSPFIKRWREWELALRLNLARLRVQKLKREGASAVDAPDYPADAALAAKNALAIESPLEAEIYLDKARWDAIESFQGISSFSESAIYAYLIKLLLMERRAAFKTEEGITEYKALYTAILGEAK
jgi:hypothetical protein